MTKTPKLLILFFLMLITLSISVSAYFEYDTSLSTSPDANAYTYNGTHFIATDYVSGQTHLFQGTTPASMSRIGTVNTGTYVNMIGYLGTDKNKYGNEEYIIRDWKNGLFHFYDGDFIWVASKTIEDLELNSEIVINPYNDYVYVFLTNGEIWEYNEDYVFVQKINENFDVEGSGSAFFSQKHFVILQIYNTDELSFLSYNQQWDLVDNTTIAFSTNLKAYTDLTFANDKLYMYESNNGNMYLFDNVYTDSFSITIDGFDYDQNYCIDANTLCSNTTAIDSIFGVQFICDSTNNIESCSGGCTNTLSGTTYEGVCEQLGCVNECNIIGQTSCTSGSTYATCGNFDSDACLEFGSVLNCPANQYCSDEEVGSQCSTLTTNTLYNQDFLSVDLDLLSQSGVIKEEGTSEKTKNIAEIGLGYVMALYPPSYLLGFDNVKTYVLESFYKDQINETYVMSSFEGTGASTNYYAYNCDYEQNYFLSDNLEHNDLNSNGWGGSGVINTTEQFNFIETTGTINKTIQEKTNSETDVIIELLETGTYNVKYYNDENLLLDFEIVNNKTNFNILVTEKQNNKLLLNSTSTSDDLQEIFIRTSFINDVEAGNNFISLIRNVLGQDINENYFSLPLGVGNSLNPNKIVFESNTNQLWIYEVIGSSIKDYPVYTNDEESIKNFECQHNQAECYIVRAYGNTQGMSTYYFYEEIQTCIQSLNGVVSVTTPDIVTTDERSTIEKALNKNWNTKQKLLFAVITLIIVFGLFGALTMADGDKTFMLIGTILTGVLMFYFIIEGFIPAWVIVLFGIVGAFISASAIRNMSTGA